MATSDQSMDPRDAIIAQLRKENRYLRAKVGSGQQPVAIGLQHVNTTGRILRRAYDDAMAILALHHANYTITRAMAGSVGISERRYYWALGLLRCARVMDRNRFTVDAYDAGSHRIEQRYHELRERADALDRLRLYMPRKMDYTYKPHPSPPADS